ncbi:hypothetical protein CDAR_443031 [Caerostris darwini]|uniref:Uncharacterized protein n=1 Tax=Caerostris darwini TaxID=1538125 RepID=A0AAV4W085_9ARAC|nr:hypothetical protein CDAR_443031 [Caerostris darwini]
MINDCRHPDIYLNPCHILSFSTFLWELGAIHRIGVIDGREAMDWRQISLATYHRDCNFVRQSFRVGILSFIGWAESILSLLHLNCTFEARVSLIEKGHFRMEYFTFLSTYFKDYRNLELHRKWRK